MTGKGEHIFSDKLNHASIMDGIFMAKGINGVVALHRYRHNDMKDLEAKLRTVPKNTPKMIVTDGVFSMEGDIVKLPELKALAEKYNAVLYLDEAHAIGVLGATGRGTPEHFGNSVKADLTMCTFSKSFGSIGGFIAGRADVIDYIKHFARPLIFSASMPPANVASVLASIEIMEKEPERPRRLQEIAQYMVKEFKRRGFDIGTAETAIIPLVTGTLEQTMTFWAALFNRGFYANPVMPPAVPPNRCLIRTSYMSTHTNEELELFLDAATEEADKLGILNSNPNRG
jgi:7-keto-8-aminopelargonate synthetase-like enzyme